MPLLTPDPMFYPSPTMAMKSLPEKFAYPAQINSQKGADAMGIVDVDPTERLRPSDWSDGHAQRG